MEISNRDVVWLELARHGLFLVPRSIFASGSKHAEHVLVIVASRISVGNDYRHQNYFQSDNRDN